jgi:hypothetical protein
MQLELMSARDTIVRIVGDVGCTGTLIAEDRVLTARACVAGHERPGLLLRVELGGDYFPWGEVGVRDIVLPACGDAAGNGGIAVIVLDRRLAGAPILPLRLGRPPEDHEDLAVFGFGRCPSFPGAIHRRWVETRRIEGIAAASFGAFAALCPGDLGAPAFGRDMDLLGVLTSGALEDGRIPAIAGFARIDACASALEGADTRAVEPTPPP